MLIALLCCIATVTCQQVTKLADADEGSVKLRCREQGQLLRSTWLRDGNALTTELAEREGGRITFPGVGILSIANLSVSDEAVYACCINSTRCSVGFQLYVDPVVNASVPTSLNAFIHDNISVADGIIRGRLSTNFSVTWEVRSTAGFRQLIAYNSSGGSGEEVLQREDFSYDPALSVLHVAQLEAFVSLRGLRLRCVFVLHRPNRRSSITRVREISLTITYIVFRTRLPTAMVTVHQRVRCHVRVQASDGMAVVEWRMNGVRLQPSQEGAGRRYTVHTDFNHADSEVRSTLIITGVTDDDTNAMVTAHASLGNKTQEQSTTHLIIVPVVNNLTLDCSWSGDILLRFNLPPHFPIFRSLTRLKPFNLTLILRFIYLTDPQQTQDRSVLLDSSRYRDLISHGVFIERRVFPSIGTYHVQARLSIDGQERSEFSTLCNRERNVYPNCLSAVSADENTAEIRLRLSFPSSDAACRDFNSTEVSNVLLSELRQRVSEVCYDLMQASLICQSSSSGLYTATILSFSLPSVLQTTTSAIEGIDSLPFAIEVLHHETTPTTVETGSGTPISIWEGVSIISAILMVLVFLILCIVGIVKFKKHCSQRASIAGVPNPHPHLTQRTAE